MFTGPKPATNPPSAGSVILCFAGSKRRTCCRSEERSHRFASLEGAAVPLTYVPPFPTYPPETSWMRQPTTSIPGLVLRERGDSRVAFLPADVDLRYAKEHLPDHGDLLANLVRWAAGSRVPMTVNGPGMIDCHLYRQGTRVILHLVNLTSAATWRAPVDELIPVGPVRVRVTPPAGMKVAPTTRLLVSGKLSPATLQGGSVEFEVPSILDHECVLIG